jgi:uncharacterized protein with NRDE domain
MCLIYLAHRVHPRYPLVVAANRDELHARPSSPAHWWQDVPGLLAGRDLQAGGTWMGVTRGGRFAAVTNFREPGARDANARSRGELVSGFLEGTDDALSFLAQVSRAGQRYNGFSLLAYDGQVLGSYSNRGGEPEVVNPGVHGLSNHLLDSPWPKVEQGLAELQRLMAGGQIEHEDLLQLMDRRESAPDHALPDSGIGLARERLLSPRFILDDHYGTRCTTVAVWSADGGVDYVERSFDRRGEARGDAVHAFSVSDSSARCEWERA